MRDADPEGDFELERPAVVSAPGGLDTESGSDFDSDFELARPAAEVPLRSGSTSTPDTDGDFKLKLPASTRAGSDAPAEAGSPGVPGVPGAADAAVTAVAATAVAGARPPDEQGALSASGAPSERPKPLHDPDPYSTPPYGGPGPWAPAPAVQHPATPPAHGAPTVVGAPTHGGAAPAAAQAHAEATPAASPPAPVPPAHDAVVPPTTPQPATASPYPDAHRPGSASYPETAQSVAAPREDASGPTAASYPGAAPPATALYAEAPQAVVKPFPEGPRPATAPYPDASQPPGASYAYPSQPGPPPFGDSAHAVPPPYAGGSQPVPPPYAGGARQSPPPPPGGSQPAPPSYADAPAPPVYADPARPLQGAPQAPQGPWQNYDPWAGSGSLQQNGAAVDDVARRRRRRVRVLLVGALLIAVVAGGIGGAVGAYLERNGGVGAVELPQAGDGVTGRAPDSVAGIAARALPGVVTLHVSGASAQGTGTGFVLDDRGHILTNNHVVDPAGTDGDISVTFSGGESAKATVVGRDTGYDLAVVKVSGVSGLKPLPLGNSEEVQVGDPVVAIGAPFDLANTVTSGIISAKERPITAGGDSGDVSDVSYVDALQTDAPINPGNSGGPLLDGKGRVIGINSAIRSAGSGSESDGGQAGSIGLGFAIPINQGKRVAEELINTGKATHPVIGVTLDMDYSGDGARIGEKSDEGASGVTAGGPADRAGIRSGDVITEVDGQRVHSGDELIVKVRAHRPGDRLELTLLRNGRERTVTLTLGSSGGN
ncbi:S1C family serine protease [Streptomyces europaeiscabiei]|nr:trypsin-like peptidase domain-containing protein [Streptomyces europaeiscabiei]MDX3860482.1 trypsin-like peptidase domain-containing protein [Streptomyces europaeiscabiei]MDX3869383.1 trypsin-like peptidase domain-containing protein [Streptomyces europaeiscabiei]